MTDAVMNVVLTGFFTLFGVVLGGLSSWIIAIYTSKKNYEERVQEKQKELCLTMLKSLNDLIDNLPQGPEDMQKYKEYLISEFYPMRTSEVLAEEMLYLSEDIRTTYFVICVMAENDFVEGCNYDVICRKLIIHRNVFVKMLREDFDICSAENMKSKNKRYDKLMNEEIKEIKREALEED